MQRAKRREIEKTATLVTLQPLALAREPTTRIRAPSRSLMRSLLSQYQTPAFPRRFVGFFGSGRRASRPAPRITQPTLDWLLFLKPTLSAVDGSNTIAFQKVVNARLLCNQQLDRALENHANGASDKAFERRRRILLRHRFSCPVEIFSSHGHREPQKVLDGAILFPARCC